MLKPWNDETALLTMAAHIEVKPARAGMVNDPKDYCWNGYGEGESAVGDRVGRRGMMRVWIAAVGTVLSLFFAVPSWAGIQIVALTGQAAPDENGVFASSFGRPVINDAGQIAFVANFSGTSEGADNDAAYLKGDQRAVEVLAREGDTLPSGDGSYRFGINFINGLHLTLDAVGNASALAQVSGGSDGAQFALVHFDEAGAVEVVRDQRIQSAETGNYFEFGSGTIASYYHPVPAEEGELYFLGILDGPEISDTNVIHRWDRETGVEYVIGTGDPLLDATTFFVGGQLRVASPDKLAMTVSYLDDGEFSLEPGIAAWTEASGHQTLIREDDVAPDGASNFVGSGPMVILDTSPDGRILSSAFVRTPTDRPQGVFLHDGSALTEVAIAGQTIDGSTLRHGIEGKLGALDVVWFTAQTLGQGTYSLFRSSALGRERFLTAGDSLPGRERTILENIGAIYPNDRGDLLFHASTYEGDVSKTGYYLLRAHGGAWPVALVGQALEGSIIQSISLGKPFGAGDWPSERPLNNRGQVTFQFQLLDGRSGIAIWNPPPPRLSIRAQANRSILSFMATDGFTYQLERLNTEADWVDGWVDFGPPIPGNGLLHETEVPFSTEDTMGFFRLRYAD